MPIKWDGKNTGPGSSLFRTIVLHPALWVAVMVLVLTAGSVLAQDCPSQKYKRSSQTPIVIDMVNPHPSDQDFELPMPCGGKLFLRPVCTPADYFFEDLQLDLGCENCRRQDEGFMESRRRAALAGAFTLADLPESWRARMVEIAKGDNGQCSDLGDGISNALFYFIGKYEISTWQWKTVMNEECPGWNKAFTTDDPRPKINISWFEAVEFTRRYTEWLLKHSPQLLPKFPDGRLAYIRLPTETEWEYAARGGHMVSDAQMKQEEFFPLKDRPISDYAVYTQTGAAKPPDKLAWIGTRCPNPLELFDIAGNAAEMTLDLFRFSKDGRLHGAVGGFAIKGGSYRKRRAEIIPGRREEMPFFIKDSAFRSSDLGFRVVLSGIVTPQNRINTLRQQWVDAYGRNRPARIASQPATPSVENDAQIVQVVIWKSLYTIESLLDYTSKRMELQKELEMLNKLKKQSLPESEIEAISRKIAKLEKEVGYYKASIEYFGQSYINSLRNIQDLSYDVIFRQIKIILQNYQEQDQIRRRLSGRLALLKKHIPQIKKNADNINPKIIVGDILSITAASQ
jgi:hypothetical protein